MWEEIGKFLCKNWLNVLLVIVGASAFIVYWEQERRKISEAASLIIMQVEDLQKRMREVGSYISEGLLNDTGFYESQILFKTDYWNKYKYYFIRKLDPFSFNIFDEFYNCASEILEQQELMKNLQKNFFFLKQQTIIQMEKNAILQALNSYNQSPVDTNSIVKGLTETIPEGMKDEQKQAIENMLNQISTTNQNINYEYFFGLYNKNKQDIHMAINQNALTKYIPVQIRISLENALKKFYSISIIGCEGYKKMKKIAGRRI